MRITSRDVAVGAISSITSIALGAVVTYWLHSRYPIVQYVKIIPAEEPVHLKIVPFQKTFHLKVLKDGYPPFVFDMDYFGYREAYERRMGWFGKERVPTLWLYRIRFANLTAMDQKRVDIVLTPKGGRQRFQVMPMGTPLYHGESRRLCSHDLIQTTAGEPVCLLARDLKAGTRSSMLIGMSSDHRPPPTDLDVTISCAEGSFARITPAQFEDIGWRTTE